MYSYTRGFTLIEVLIGLVLLSLILLGFDGIGMLALQKSQETYFYEAAENQMQVITERLMALHNLQNLNAQINQWNGENEIILPQGYGLVQGVFPSYEVSVFWGERNNTQVCTMTILGHSGCIKRKIQLD